MHMLECLLNKDKRKYTPKTFPKLQPKQMSIANRKNFLSLVVFMQNMLPSLFLWNSSYSMWE